MNPNEPSALRASGEVLPASPAADAGGRRFSARLVELFVGFNDWPTNRKTLLLTALVLPAQVLGLVAGHFVFARAGVVDMPLFDRVFAGGCVAMTVCLIISVVASRGRQDSRVAAHAVVFLYGGFVVALIQIMGTWSTPMLSLWPLVTLFVAIWFDTRMGWLALGYGVVLAVGVRVLEATGVLRYAPALIERSVDAQQSAWWIAGNILLVAIFFLFCFALSVLVVAARRVQDLRLREAHARLDRSSQLIGRYLPSQLAQRILCGEHTETLRPVRAKLTVFFSDVEGFTDASDRLDPEELESVLNDYLSGMTEIADAHGATISQIVGDGIMIFFGAPQATHDRDHALRAVRMAQEMQRRMAQLDDAWLERGIEKPFRIRIGINTGYASVGDYGSAGRILYSAIGVQTNLAARIQAHCRPGGILISHTTWALIRDEIPCVEKGELELKGLHYPVRVYEVRDEATLTSEGKVIAWPRTTSAPLSKAS